MQILVYVVFALAVCWILAVWPGEGRKERMEVFGRRLIAHRGLHDNGGPAPENSIPAFAAAVAAGYGVELDVREADDETLVVSHDDTLKRTAGQDRDISGMTWRELRDIRLFHSEERIPLFEEALGTVAGRVPLIVEVKCENLSRVEPLCSHVAEALDVYQGPMCIESFNPMVLRWFRKNRPETLRGQLSEKYTGLSFPWIICGFLASCCAGNFFTKPDFIAWNWKQTGLMRFRILRDLFHATTAAWTVRSPEVIRKLSQDYDIFICEGFLPETAQTGSLSDNSGPECRNTGEGGRRTPHAADPGETVGGRKGIPDWNGEARDRCLTDADSGKNGKAARSRRRREKAMRDVIRKHLLVSGQVTAVGFRYRATWIAQSLGVTGWVRNVCDDRVEMEIQGPRSVLDEMMTRLGEQRFIEITDVEEQIIPAEEHEYEFKVRY